MSRPWMPLYVADYLADTGHLSTIEHGAYLLLIMHYWQNSGLPQEDAKLARITRTTPREWAGMRDTLAEFFSDGWSHARIDRELSSAREAYERRANAGRKGGIAQAQPKPGSSNALAGELNNAQASEASIAQARPKQSQSQSHILPSRRRGSLPGEGVSSPHPRQARPAPPPASAARDDDAPFGRDADDGGTR